MEGFKFKLITLFLTFTLIGLGIFLVQERVEKIKERKAEEAQIAKEKEANREALTSYLETAISSIKENTDLNVEDVTPPAPPSMERMKLQGCVTDGMLNAETKDARRAIGMINDSNCYYLHRAIETWLLAPDFEDIQESINQITLEEKVYGMFIAEAIDTKADYYSITKGRELDFDEMCKKGTDNFWGEHTCVPHLKESEYQNYVFDITTRAIDMGVQGFMFGQIHYQDDESHAYVEDLLEKIRSYAEFRGIEIVIGAQTNDIDDEDYLKLFDFIEGGVGIDEDGKVENGPCFSRWWKKKGDWCWALLWHDDFKDRANNVLVHLDWSGKIGDDMSIFARMDKEERAETLEYLRDYFKEEEVGFLMPMLAVLHKENGGCHGDSRKFYSASNKYSCQDEGVINKLLTD